MNNVDVENILFPYFKATEYFDDMIYDFLTMTAERLMVFGESIDDLYKEKLESKIKNMVVYSKTPVFENRVYIINNMENILFATHSLSDNEIEWLKKKLMVSGSLRKDIPDFLKLPPSVVITLYIFHQKDNPYRLNIFPTELAYILEHYSQQNVLIDYGI